MIEQLSTRETEKPTTEVAVYTPPNIITNEIMAGYLTDVLNVRKKSGEAYTAGNIEEVTGIKQRHYCNEIGAPPLDRSKIVPEMGTKVALKALQGRADWEQVDEIFASTSFPYKKSLGKEVAQNLKSFGYKVENANPDVYAECTSPVWILNYIRENESRYEGKNILMIASEYVNPISDDTNATLPSDAATAIAFTNGVDLTIKGSAVLHSPELKNLIRVSIMPEYEPPEGSLFFCEVDQPGPHKKLYGEEKYGLNLRYGEMEGRQVFAWAINPDTLPHLVDKTCEIAKVKREEIDLVIPHQANGRMFDYFGKLISIEDSKIFSNIKNHGNSGSASTMLAWHDAQEQGLIKKNSKVLVVGFGAGMLAGAALVEVNK